MELEYTELTVQTLLRQATRDRSIALPEFQRPYVWDESDVAAMLHTVINDWPAGTILLIGSKELINRFAFKPLEGAPDVTTESVRTLVLDGQQRLTSVFQVLTNNHAKFVFYLDMRRLHQQNNFDDECLRWTKREEFPQPQEAAEKLWIPIHELYDDRSFGEWLDRIDKDLAPRMQELFDGHLWPIREYKFPANTLPAELEFASLVRIFDKLNRLGEPLETFDLLVALLLPDGFQLRERAEEATKVFASVSDKFKIQPIEVTKLIALHEHLRQTAEKAAGTIETVQVGGIREDDVLDLVEYDASLVTAQWDDAVSEIAQSLEFLRAECGAVTGNLLPSAAMLLSLSLGLAYEEPRPDFRTDLKRWVWASYFTQAYAQGANTRATADAKELIEWSKNAEKKPTAIRAARDSARTRRGATPRQPEGEQAIRARP